MNLSLIKMISLDPDVNEKGSTATLEIFFYHLDGILRGYPVKDEA